MCAETQPAMQEAVAGLEGRIWELEDSIREARASADRERFRDQQAHKRCFSSPLLNLYFVSWQMAAHQYRTNGWRQLHINNVSSVSSPYSPSSLSPSISSGWH